MRAQVVQDRVGWRTQVGRQQTYCKQTTKQARSTATHLQSLKAAKAMTAADGKATATKELSASVSRAKAKASATLNAATSPEEKVPDKVPTKKKYDGSAVGEDASGGESKGEGGGKAPTKAKGPAKKTTKVSVTPHEVDVAAQTSQGEGATESPATLVGAMVALAPTSRQGCDKAAVDSQAQCS